MNCLLPLLMTCVVAAVVAKSCVKNDHSCLRNEECCDGCCHGEKCVPHADYCSLSSSLSCAVHECPPGKTCYLHTVECLSAPCPPVPACRDPDYDEDYSNS